VNHNIKAAVVIPARYASKRFPGKPLEIIAGKSMLERVCSNALHAKQQLPNIKVIVATDDAAIMEHAQQLIQNGLDIAVALTDPECATGSDRVLAACKQAELLPTPPDIVVNLQGDNPLLPPSFIVNIIQELAQDPSIDVATPIVNLSWDALDDLRSRKLTTPFSGTTAILESRSNNAVWFSKNIIPAIRPEVETKLRTVSNLSPVYLHVGLYGYRFKTLEQYVELPQSKYELLESLEQLRMLENGITIRGVVVDYSGPHLSGVDTKSDAARVEQIILQYGDPPNV
jgi:3-deoxy-manno-octulosonate cytidylyltransferase (CMP-KDO synthetase)